MLGTVYETTTELADLDDLLTRSLRGSSNHLRSIVTEGERTLDAAETSQLLTGMCTLALATRDRSGEPRISGDDGHFLHGRWVFTTAGDAVKVRHLRARPAVSAAHIVGDDLGIFCHGRAEEIPPDHADFRRRSRSTWSRTTARRRAAGAHEIVYARIQPHWMVAYAFAKQRLLAEAATTA